MLLQNYKHQREGIIRAKYFGELYQQLYAGMKSCELSGSTGYASGHSVYAYSLVPCQRLYKFQASTLTANIFNQVGIFTYTPKGRVDEIATDDNLMQIERCSVGGKHLLIVPRGGGGGGKEEPLPYKDSDDLNQTTITVYQIEIKNNSEDCTVIVDPAYQYMTHNKIILHGNTSSEATIVLSALASRWRALYFRVKMLPCPPGFTLQARS